jgi:hypothetical protein
MIKAGKSYSIVACVDVCLILIFITGYHYLRQLSIPDKAFTPEGFKVTVKRNDC